MLRNLMLLREKGELINQEELEESQSHTWTFTGTIPTSCSDFSNRRLIWIRGYENCLISLDSLGDAFLHSIFPGVLSKINNPGEKIVKLVLFDDKLFVVTRANNSEFLSFSFINSQSLHVFVPVRQQILSSLFAHIEEIEEVDIENTWVVIRKTNFLQLWNTETSVLQYEFSIQGSVYSKYSHGHIILCYLSEGLKVVLHCIEDDKKIGFNFQYNSNIHYAEVTRNSLALCFGNSQVVSIDLEAYSVSLVGTCKRLYELEECSDAFVLLSNDTGVFLSNPKAVFNCGNIGGIFVNNGCKVFIYSKEKKSVFIIDNRGKLEEIKLEAEIKISALGFSKSSSSFYIGKKNGVISVFD